MGFAAEPLEILQKPGQKIIQVLQGESWCWPALPAALALGELGVSLLGLRGARECSLILGCPGNALLGLRVPGTSGVLQWG